MAIKDSFSRYLDHDFIAVATYLVVGSMAFAIPIVFVSMLFRA